MIFPFKGLMPPVLTAFSDDSEQRLLLDGVPAYARYLLDVQRVSGVLVNGTSGEGMSMTVDERNASTEAWLAAAKGTSLKVMVQVGGACLKDVQAMASHAQAHGAAALLCLPDLFNRPASCDELVAYLGHVARAAPTTPLLYYHMPAYTNVDLDLGELFAKASRAVPSFAGAKFTSNNLEAGARAVRTAKRLELSVFLGCDTVLAGALALGFDSAIATTLNFVAAPSHDMLCAAAKGDVTSSLQRQGELTSLIDLITEHGGWVASMKVAMNALTPVQVGKPRPPLKALTDVQEADVRRKLHLADAKVTSVE